MDENRYIANYNEIAQIAKDNNVDMSVAVDMFDKQPGEPLDADQVAVWRADFKVFLQNRQ